MLSAMNPTDFVIPRLSGFSLSSLSLIAGPDRFRPISFPSTADGNAPAALIRMGGGPRTYPGGVSKWQWKRMQAKKAKQLLKARLCRERHLYEMRKRAELKAAISELERPWEVVERAPTLLSVSADEQVKALADRFQRPGGFDMWSERDGPQIFRAAEGLPSARFFPKGVVHSLKPYGIVAGDPDPAAADDGSGDEDEDIRYDDWIARGGGGMGRGRRARRALLGLSWPGSERLGSPEWGEEDEGENRVASWKEEGDVLADHGGGGRGGKKMGRVSLRPTTELCLEEDDHGRRGQARGMVRARGGVGGLEEYDNGRRAQDGKTGRARGGIRVLEEDDHGWRDRSDGMGRVQGGIRGLEDDDHGRRARGEGMGRTQGVIGGLEEDDHGSRARVVRRVRAGGEIRGLEEGNHGRRARGEGMGRARWGIRGLKEDNHGRRAQVGGMVRARGGIRGLEEDNHRRRARGEGIRGFEKDDHGSRTRGEGMGRARRQIK